MNGCSEEVNDETENNFKYSAGCAILRNSTNSLCARK